MTESPLVDSGFAVLVFSPEYDLIVCLNKAMAFLTAIASSRGDKVKVILVLVIRVMILVLRETMQVDMQGLLSATTVKTGDLDTYDSDCDDFSNAKVVLMANISNYGFDVISKVPHSETYLNDMENQRQSMQRPSLFESDSSIYLENRFETYVKSKDLDIWHVITEVDFQPIQNNSETNLDENGKSDRKFFRCEDPNHLIGECPKPSRDKNQMDFVEGSWSDSGEEDDEKAKDETCLIAQASSKAYNGGDVIFEVIYAVTSLEKDVRVIGRCIRKRGLYVMKLGKKPEDKIVLATIDENFTLCPFAVKSYGGNLYTLVIVDDYSRMDHGREFDNEVQFGEFCNANGITHNETMDETM
nr:alpha/beta hydrolases superfamily protein [Tanacetum cinerariifolium]